MAVDAKPKKSKLQLEPYQVLIRPLVTEKGYATAERYNTYTFEVSKFADKVDVRQAVEEMFDVKVVRVNMQNRKGKPRRHRFAMSHTKSWKKAIVKLDPEHRIDFF